MNGLVRIEEKVVFDRIGFNVQIDDKEMYTKSRAKRVKVLGVTVWEKKKECSKE
ncbi:MAG: hypothetical protein IJR02_14705 [Bacteroidaceae bacterium]|nr:hypothetical protein [Bacteroidaceae bacterium]MBQ6751997.1 hypothetical protein [Bacteroidaceae bacterium]